MHPSDGRFRSAKDRGLVWLSLAITRAIAGLFRLMAIPFVRWEFRGGATIQAYDNWVMSANHRSVFDFPHAIVALRHYGVYARVMIASEFWRMPAYAWAVRAIDAIPVYRKTDPRGSFDAAIRALKDGDSVAIMPEGGLHWDPDNPLQLGRFKTGVSRLAVGSGVPVLAIALVGGERVWTRPRRFPRMIPFRRRTVLVRVADEPLWLYGDDHRANASTLRDVQEELLQQATRDLQAIDPSYMPDVAA
ncbi:lysophospholipid acyltransferase family protein [Euzebya tangerina]|uniref:lysophospholipid acyltransferase family protein n=1 Tax=Euzebya tangerina TaxID=591198 RepID=UPI000E3117EE|nr:lysophospholipid acyltransferase family protein [Euzebya tangerina]